MTGGFGAALGVLVFFLVVAAVPRALSLAQGAVRSLGLAWIAAVLAGIVALGGTWVVTVRIVSRILEDGA